MHPRIEELNDRAAALREIDTESARAVLDSIEIMYDFEHTLSRALSGAIPMRADYEPNARKARNAALNHVALYFELATLLERHP